ALQMDFVRRDTLIGAMNAWILAKHRTLGEILVEQGAMPAEVCDQLAALVQRHVKMHGGIAARSLATLDTAGRAPARLQDVADPDVKASRRQLPETPARDDPSSTIVQPGGGKGRFRVLRLHATGGLGEVYVAYDEELNRQVALKEIQARFAASAEAR